MKTGTMFACAAALFALAAGVRDAGAQTPCTTSRAVIDSARDDVLTILGSQGRLVTELRQEQGLDPDKLAPITVTDRAVCARMAPAFNRVIPPGIEYAVLKVGPLYYARDPDQHRSTGVFTDSAFRVVMRLGAEVPEPRRRP